MTIQNLTSTDRETFSGRIRNSLSEYRYNLKVKFLKTRMSPLNAS